MHGSPQAPDQVGSRTGFARAGDELGNIDRCERHEAFAAMVRTWRPEFDSRARIGVSDDYCS
jgi:hypothetical protein